MPEFSSQSRSEQDPEVSPTPSSSESFQPSFPHPPLASLIERISTHLGEQPSKTSTFFAFNNSIAFIRRDTLMRSEVPPAVFSRYLTRAEKELPGGGHLVATRVRQLTGEILSPTDRINLISAILFPENPDMRRASISLFSPDLPHQPPSELHIAQLRTDLVTRGDEELVTEILDARLEAEALLEELTALDGYSKQQDRIVLTGKAQERVNEIMNRFVDLISHSLTSRDLIPGI